ncbi:unnamed protein product [Urochloa humidicola]
MWSSQFESDGRVLFYLEMMKNYNPEEADSMEQSLETELHQLADCCSIIIGMVVMQRRGWRKSFTNLQN